MAAIPAVAGAVAALAALLLWWMQHRKTKTKEENARDIQRSSQDAAARFEQNLAKDHVDSVDRALHDLLDDMDASDKLRKDTTH